MRFSVLICTHNRGQVLPQALGALGQLDVPAEWGWELVVVDNASRDDSAWVVKDFASRSSVPVRYVYEQRLGHSFALNAGVRACRGEVIAFTDDDACPFPDWLRQLQKSFEEYQADLVFGKAVPLWETEAPPWFSRRLNPNFALLDYGPKPFVVQDMRTPFFGVNHACRRDVLLALGGYREELGLFGAKGGTGNDLDLMERALAAGKRIVYNPDAVVRHIIPGSRCRKGHHRRSAFWAGEFFYPFLRDNPPAVPWLFGLPRYYFRQAASDLVDYLKALARRRRDESFYYELRLLRFFGLCYQACGYRLRRNRPLTPAGAERPLARPAPTR
jgi:glycosyltransferase involved in cell wall biosynthesis